MRRAKVVWSARALRRLLEIRDYVAVENPAAAGRLAAHLVGRAMSLSIFPMRGRAVAEASGSTLREVVDGNYRIVYRATGDRVEIVTVFEGHRRFPREDVE